MQMLSLAAALIAEAVVHFDNGMIGAITKGGKIALVDKAGVSTKAKYMPLVEDYLAVNSPIMIEHTFRIGKDEYYHETVWVDDEWDFENKCWDFSIMDAGAEVIDISVALAKALGNGGYRVKELIAA